MSDRKLKIPLTNKASPLFSDMNKNKSWRTKNLLGIHPQDEAVCRNGEAEEERIILVG